jgi:tetraacyldisaccharide 4'-kinase
VNLLAGLFAMGVRARNALYDRGALRAKRLAGPVVSIGNLSVGGSGKTPFIITLGELLKQRGVAYDVLTRGYGRSSKGVRQVDADGSAREFGDEPILIARKLGVPVIVGEDRYQAGLFAEKHFGPQMHLLDDGFQHRQLARDFDIVLVTPDDARDQLIPKGRLREPLTALARADAVVLTSGASPERFPLDGKLVWRARRGIVARNLPPQPLVFCGIARPQQFFLQLRTAGVDAAAEATFRDHHAYTEKDVLDLAMLRDKSGAGGYVTTEKDAINLGMLLSALEPIAVVPVKMDLVDAARALDTMLGTLAERRKPVA